jgi:hypothetical protein
MRGAGRALQEFAMPAKPTDKRTAVGRMPAASVQGEDVCALVTDRRFATPPGEHAQGDSRDAAETSRQPTPADRKDDSTPPPASEAVQHGRSSNDKGYQEAPDDERRATQDQRAGQNPALLHRARTSAPDAESTLARQPDDRRR